MDIQKEFEKAAKNAKLLDRPDNDTLLRLYALYKQATAGNVQGKRPGFTDFVGRMKFDAWKNVEGMGKEDAMQQYVDLVAQLKGD